MSGINPGTVIPDGIGSTDPDVSVIGESGSATESSNGAVVDDTNTATDSTTIEGKAEDSSTDTSEDGEDAGSVSSKDVAGRMNIPATGKKRSLFQALNRPGATA